MIPASTAHVITHFTPLLRELHWLPIRERVRFEVACLVRQSLFEQAPLYLADDCCLVSDSTRRSLRSADVPTCVVPQTFRSYGDRTFAAAGPRLWNSGSSVPAAQSRHHLRTIQTTAEGTLFGKHEHGALRLLIWGASEKHLLTYLLTYT